MADQIISKQCSKCKEVKPLSEFYKSCIRKDGYNYHCKLCCKKYRQSEKGKLAQKRYQEHYRKTEKCKAAKRRYSQSKKRKAISTVRYAVIKGSLPKVTTLKCKCGKTARHYHHYKGYAPKHWLDVIPLCFECHYVHNQKTLRP